MIPEFGEQSGEFDPPEPTRERHLGLEPQPAALFLERTELRAVARDGQPELGVAGCQAMDGIQQIVDALALDQPAGEDHRRLGAPPPGTEEVGVHAVWQDANSGIGCGELRHGSQAVADRKDPGRITPDTARDMTQQQRVQQPKALVIAGHVRAAQRHDVGLLIAQPPTDQSGRQARPAVAQVERPVRKQLARAGSGADHPPGQLVRLPEGQLALAHGKQMDGHPGFLDNLEPAGGSTGDHVDAQVRPLGQQTHDLRAGDPGTSADRRHLVA